MGLTNVPVCGVNSAACRYSAGVVGWRMHAGTIEGQLLLSCEVE